jgi:hypothetical protein
VRELCLTAAGHGKAAISICHTGDLAIVTRNLSTRNSLLAVLFTPVCNAIINITPLLFLVLPDFLARPARIRVCIELLQSRQSNIDGAPRYKLKRRGSNDDQQQ